MYAEILTTRKLFTGQPTLTYALPEEDADKFQPGRIVEIPLRNSTTKGLILSRHSRNPKFQTKAILQISEEIGLSSWQLELMQWMSEYYFCPLNKILQSFVPKKLLSKVKRRKKEINESIEAITSSHRTLTETQKTAFEQIISSGKKSFVLHGVTGAGKTEIYLQLATHYAQQGKQVLILVPEIALTPQTVRYFQKSFPSQLSVIHSKLSAGEKIQAWEDIYHNRSKLVIGSRSSIFAPYQNLGAIILDEEHDTSYKQDQSPRYHARDVAFKVSELTGCKVVLGSATPSIESYYHSLHQTHQLLSLKARFNQTELPAIKLIDLRREQQKNNYSIFSDELRMRIAQKIEQKEQVLLFLNKRGSSSTILCKDCGHTVNCHKCDITMTYHQKPSFQSKPVLLCHHCGIVQQPPETCTECQSANIKFFGAGTQKVESELQEIFPHARILRADKDTTSTKHGFKEIYEAFRNHEADILIGTQMISKGLHLPKVNLVGVILADVGVHMPDFRAHERTFQLLTQVAGRAGRKSGNGEVLIQTYNPETDIMQLSSQQDFIDFYHHELPIRQSFNYPPFSKLIKLTYEHPDAKTAFQTAQKTKKELDEILKNLIPYPQSLTPKISLYPAMLHKRNDKYRWCILINSETPHQIIHQANKKDPNLLKDWIHDVDPIFSS